MTYDIDAKHGTTYHERFKDFLGYVQEHDYMSAGAMTDARGDRSLRPHQQKNPKLYLHISERGDDGIVVNGAKAHITGVINSHEIIVMPTRAMGEEDKDFRGFFRHSSQYQRYQVGFRQTNQRQPSSGEPLGLGQSEICLCRRGSADPVQRCLRPVGKGFHGRGI